MLKIINYRVINNRLINQNLITKYYYKINKNYKNKVIHKMKKLKIMKF